MKAIFDLRCLSDAGMPPEQVEHCAQLCREGKNDELLATLQQWRVVLLDGLHQSQKPIDCLDYSCWMLQKTQGV